MELRPGYKKSDIGVIPEDWDAVSLGSIGESLIGLTYAPTDVRRSGTLVLRSSNIQNGALAFEDNVFVEKYIPEKIKVRPGDVLVCVRNGSRELIGKAALLDERTNGMTFGAFMALFRSKIGALVNYHFQSDILKRQINEHLGATINQITNKSLNSFTIPVPRKASEKKAIAEALSDVDAATAALTRLIAKKRDLRQGTMQRLLIGQFRLPGFESKSMRTKETEIGSIPEDWELVPLSQAFEIQLGKMLDAEKNTGVPKPYLGNRAVQWGRIDAIELPTMRMTPADMSKFRLEKGDLLVCEGGEVGRCAIYMGDPAECYYQKALHRLRPRGQVDPRLLVALFRRYSELGIFSNYVTQTSIAHLPKEKISLIPVLQLSDKEQNAILNAFHDTDAEIAALEARLEKTRALKQAMMQALLIGRVRLSVRRDAALPMKEAANA